MIDRSRALCRIVAAVQQLRPLLYGSSPMQYLNGSPPFRKRTPRVNSRRDPLRYVGHCRRDFPLRPTAVDRNGGFIPIRVIVCLNQLYYTWRNRPIPSKNGAIEERQKPIITSRPDSSKSVRIPMKLLQSLAVSHQYPVAFEGRILFEKRQVTTGFAGRTCTAARSLSCVRIIFAKCGRRATAGYDQLGHGFRAAPCQLLMNAS